MSPIDQFHKLARPNDTKLTLWFFCWNDEKGGHGDYGVNNGEARATYNTLISTTYMFQPNPAFTIFCHPVEMTALQFEYLQDQDLDTKGFLTKLEILQPAANQINLADYQDAATALQALDEILT